MAVNANRVEPSASAALARLSPPSLPEMANPRPWLQSGSVMSGRTEKPLGGKGAIGGELPPHATSAAIDINERRLQRTADAIIALDDYAASDSRR